MNPTYEDVVSVVAWAREVAARFVITDGYATCGWLDHGDHPIDPMPDFVTWAFEHWHCRTLDTQADTTFRSRS